MSWQATGYVKPLRVSSTGKEITRGEKLVLLLLADYIHPDTGVAWPSMETIADEAMYERRQVLRILESLETKGFITIERSEGKTTNRYRICGVVTKCHNKKKSNSDISGDILPSNSDISEPNSDIAVSLKPIDNHKAIEEPKPTTSQEGFSLVSENSNGTPKKLTRGLEKSCDPRYKAVTAKIFEAYKCFNKVDPGWGDPCGKQLKNFLASHPDWNEEKIFECIRNRYKSEINLAEEPIKWISSIGNFAGGPLDKYGKPKSTSNGFHNGQPSRTNGSGATGHLLDHLPSIEEIQERRKADDERLRLRREARQ
jgi:hypothetical protein